MLAEPKGKRGRTDSAWSDSVSPALHVRHADTALALISRAQLDGLSRSQGCKAEQALVPDPAPLLTRFCRVVSAKGSDRRRLAGKQVKTDMSCARSNSALLPSPIGNGEAVHRLHELALLTNFSRFHPPCIFCLCNHVRCKLMIIQLGLELE